MKGKWARRKLTLTLTLILLPGCASYRDPTMPKPPIPCSDADLLGVLQPFDRPPEPIHMVPAVYPEIPRTAVAEGIVRVWLMIGRSGHVCNATVESSNTIQVLEEAAIAAALKWQFKPAKRKGKPVASRIVVPFLFPLDSIP